MITHISSILEMEAEVHEFKANLDYIVSYSLPWAIEKASISTVTTKEHICPLPISVCDSDYGHPTVNGISKLKVPSPDT